MSLIPNKTHLTPSQALFAPYTVVPQISTIVNNISTLTTPNPIFSTITVNNGYIGLGNNNHLSTIGGELYYNLEPLALVSSLSSIADWSLEPAISSINMDGYDILSANNVNANHLKASTATISTIATNDVITSTLSADTAVIETQESSTIVANLVAGNDALFSSINVSTITATNLAFLSSYTYTSTISSMLFEGDIGDIDKMMVSSLTGNTSLFSTLDVSSINGYEFPQVLPPPFTLPADIVCSTLYADTSISTATLFTGGLGSRVRLGGIPDTPLTFTSFANSQTHGSATGNYTINAFVGDIVLNGSNDILVNSSNDFTVTAGDVNLTQTDATSVFNITTAGAGLMAFGLALDITTTSYLAINSGGNVSIGSANILGADTEIEKVGFKENQIYKAGLNDLEIADVSSINGYKYIPTQLWASEPASQNVNMNAFSLSNASTINVSTLFGNRSSTLETYCSSINLGSITGANDVNFSAVGSFNMNGGLINMGQGEIHNCRLVHSQNNQNITIEGKGNGLVNLSSISTVVSAYFKADSMGVSSINASSMTITTINAISTITTHNQVSSIFISTLCAGGLSTGQALLTLRGGNSATAVNGTPQLSFDWSQTNGGFTHWMTTRHNSMASNAGNAIDFWINNSTIYNGSTYPAIGNCNILSITGAGVGINVSSPAFALEVGGSIRNTTFISTVSSINNLVFTSTLATNTISSQLLNISTVSARAVTATALNYPAVAVTSSGNNTFTFTDVHTYVINTYAGAGNATWTLPTASSYQGRIIFIKNNAATPQIVSNANNVIPQAGGVAGTAICGAGTGKFSVIVSDGSNWVIMISN